MHQETMKGLRDPLSEKCSWGQRKGAGHLSINMDRLFPEVVLPSRQLFWGLVLPEGCGLWRQGSSQLTRWAGFMEHACGAKPPKALAACQCLYIAICLGDGDGNCKLLIGHQNGSC